MSDDQFAWLLVLASITFFIWSVICAIGAYIMIFGGHNLLDERNFLGYFQERVPIRDKQ